MADRTKPLKIESPTSGGTQIDWAPCEVNPNQDGVDCNALFLQSTSSADSKVYVDRDSADQGIRFTEPTVGVKKLNRLVSNSLSDTQSHQALLDIIHFLDDGPGDGWASGAFRQDTYTGVLLKQTIWYASATNLTAIVGRAYTYSGILVSTETLTLYAPSGAAVRTVIDTYGYAGLLMTSCTRTYK